jgi:hypothetical protein
MTHSRAAISVTAIFLLGAVLAAAPAKGQAVPSLRPQQALPSPHSGSSSGPATPSGQDNSLGHQLSRSRGVIKPPPVHDQNVIMPPNGDSLKTPVIAPPGTPGGDPAIIPK